MPYLDDFKPMPVPRWGGAVDYQQGPGGQQDATKVIPGCAIVAQNHRFGEDFTATRYGNRTTMKGATPEITGAATGIDVLEVLGEVNPGEIPVVFTDQGVLFKETPVGSQNLVPLSTPLPLPPNARMQTTQRANRLHMAFSDGAKGLIPPLVLDGRTGTLNPLSQNTIGALWNKGLYYLVGDVVRSGDGRWWRCNLSATGLSQAQGPIWPLGYGQFVGNVWTPLTVTDLLGGQSQWEEWTPNCANSLPAPDVVTVSPLVTHTPGAGTITAGQDVYIKIAFRVALGESPRSAPIVFVNTSANDEITIAFGNNGGVHLPRWIAEINLQSSLFQPVTLDVYVTVVATGSAIPADSAYLLYAQGLSLGVPIVVTRAASAATMLSPSAASGNFNAPGNAFDQNLNTGSSGVSGEPGGPLSAAETWSGFAAGIAAGQSLFIKSQAQFANAGGGADLQISLNGGVTWQTIYATGVNRPAAVDVLALTDGQDLTEIQVRAESNSFSGQPHSPAIAAITIYEIWVATNNSLVPTVVGPANILLTNVSSPTLFRGVNGTRYMIVLRQDQQGSLSPVDPDSPIPITIQGQVSANILAIERTGGGLVKATVTDITEFAQGQQIAVEGCTGDVTFNGTFPLLTVEGTQAPEGVLTWQDSNHLSASNDTTGSVELPPALAPIAFLPPGGSNDILDIAGFTVATEGPAGPYFYIAQADIPVPASSTIVSIQGGQGLQEAITAITRFAGGEVHVQVADISGFSIGMPVAVAGCTTDPSFNEDTVLTGVEPTTGTGGILIYDSVNSAASADTTGTISAIIASGSAIAVLASATGMAVGQVLVIQGTSNSAFNGQLAGIAAINQNVVTLALTAAGSATGGTATVQQQLPTCGSSPAQPITAITRDNAGNVSAQVPNLQGWSPGQIVNVFNCTDPSFDGIAELTSVTLNPDGLSGVVGWNDPGPQTTSAGGFVEGFSDFLINFDDTLLTSEADLEVTGQLTAIGAPMAADISWVPSLGMMSYTTGQDDSFYFSDEGDPGNLSGAFSALEISDRKMSLAIAVRELESGEILALKQDGGYQLNPSDLPPSQWNAPRRWDKYGPCCAPAIGLGSDFLAFPSQGEEAGAYLYKAGEQGIEWISREYSTTWKRVNWAARNSFWTEVDEQAKELHFGVALDGATEVTHELVCCYFSGWGEPEVLNRYGKLIANRSGRKWSIWPIASKTAKVVKRSIASSDSRVATRQLLRGVNQIAPVNQYPILTLSRKAGVVVATLGVSVAPVGPFDAVLVTGVHDSSFNGQFGPATLANPSRNVWTLTWDQDGPQSNSGWGAVATTNHQLRVWMVQPDVYDDDGMGIDAQYQPAYAQDEQGTAVLRFGGYRGQVGGAGSLFLTPMTDQVISGQPKVFPTDTVRLIGTKPTSFERGLRLDHENATLLFSNHAVPGSWYMLLKAVMYAIPFQAGRRLA